MLPYIMKFLSDMFRSLRYGFAWLVFTFRRLLAWLYGHVAKHTSFVVVGILVVAILGTPVWYIWGWYNSYELRVAKTTQVVTTAPSATSLPATAPATQPVIKAPEKPADEVWYLPTAKEWIVVGSMLAVVFAVLMFIRPSRTWLIPHLKLGLRYTLVIYGIYFFVTYYCFKALQPSWWEWVWDGGRHNHRFYWAVPTILVVTVWTWGYKHWIPRLISLVGLTTLIVTFVEYSKLNENHGKTEQVKERVVEYTERPPPPPAPGIVKIYNLAPSTEYTNLKVPGKGEGFSETVLVPDGMLLAMHPTDPSRKVVQMQVNDNEPFTYYFTGTNQNEGRSIQKARFQSTNDQSFVIAFRFVPR